MGKYTKTILIILSLWTMALSVKAETILPKEDAAAMFDMTFIQWRQNVLAAERAGVVRSDSLRPLELTMIADVPHGRVITTPSYKSEDTFPWKISVAVIFTPSASEMFLAQAESDFMDLIQRVHQEMRPEYTVVTELWLSSPDGLARLNSQIFRAGDFPVLDAAAKANNGCWQECIK